MLHKMLENFSVNLGCRLLVSIIFVSIMTTTNALASPCSGQVAQNRDTAQNNFRASCGQEWDDKLRHQCTWVDNPASGWICHEYAPNGLATIAPEETDATLEDNASSLSPPFPIHAEEKNDFISVVWRKDAGTHGINVYRNDQWVASVNYPGTVYNDYSGQLGDRYYLIAYDRDNNFSARSAVFVALRPRIIHPGLRPTPQRQPADEWQEVTDQRPSGPDDITSTDGWQPVTNTDDTEEGSPGNPYGDSSGYPATPRTPYVISVTPSTRSAVITWTIPYTTAENVYCDLHIYNVATGERTTGRGRIQCPGHGRRTLTIGDRGDSLSPNTEYLVRVRAFNAQGQTSWSKAFRFRTQ
ncbi:MAG: fibronectin type III domain-containing protein [Thiotrichaceae bacterium]